MNYKYKDFKHGQRCTCVIDGTKITDAKISINPTGGVYICQNKKDGVPANNKLGYRYSWHILYKGQDFKEGRAAVTKLKLLGKGDKMAKAKKLSYPYYLVIYNEKDAGDPQVSFQTAEDAIEWVNENLDSIELESVKIYEVSAEFKLNFEFKKVS